MSAQPARGAKQDALKVLLGTFGLALALGLGTQLWNPPRPILTGSDDSMQQYESYRLEVARNGRCDLVFIGNSFTRQGIDVDAFDRRFETRTGRPIESFNFGAGGTPLSVLPHLTRLLYRIEPPPVVVMILTPQMFSFQAHPRAVVDASPYGTAFLDPTPVRGLAALWLLDHVEVFAQRYAWKNQLLLRPEQQRISATYQRRRGYQPSTNRSSSIQISEELERKRRERLRRINSSAYSTLTSSIEIARKGGSTVWLVEGAANPRFISAIARPEERIRDIRAVLRRAGDELGVHVLLLPPSSRPIAQDFADVNHLNPDGAIRFTHWIADAIDTRSFSTTKPRPATDP